MPKNRNQSVLWTFVDEIYAGRQGWGIFFNTDTKKVEIQRIDDMLVFDFSQEEPLFESDEEALRFVKTAASLGDERAKRALLLVSQ